MLTCGRIHQPADNRQNASGIYLAYTYRSRNMFCQNHEFTSKNKADLLALLYVIKTDTFKIYTAQQLMDQYGRDAQFIVLDIHGAVRFPDWCIEDIEKELMQQCTPMDVT